MGWLWGWGKRIKITIDKNDVDVNLTNFPILVYLSSSSGITSKDITAIFDELGANSLKIAVTTSDGTVECYVEVDEWDNGSELAYLWVKVPSISSSEDTILYIYYDNDHADNTDYVGPSNSTPAENVWDANFELVTHMKDDPNTASIRDSTDNNWDGTKVGANEPLEGAGQIGRGQIFDGINDATDHGDIDIDLEISIEFWYKKVAAQIPCVHKNVSYFAYWEGGGGLLYGRAYNEAFIGQIGGAIDNAWHHYVWTWKASTFQRLWEDGTMLKEQAVAAAGIVQNASPTRIGDIYATARASTMDEVRIHLTERSASWWKANYETQRDHFLVFGEEEIPVVIGPHKAKKWRVQIIYGGNTYTLGTVEMTDFSIGRVGGVESKYGKKMPSDDTPDNKHRIGMKRANFVIRRWLKADEIESQHGLLFDLHNNDTEFQLTGFIKGDYTITITGITLLECIIHYYRLIIGGANDIIGEEVGGYALNWEKKT